MASVVQGTEKTILFDTGGDARILLRNLRTMGIAPEHIDVIVLSHNHADHTGGLVKFLAENPKVKIYVPVSFASEIQRRTGKTAAEVIAVDEAEEIVPHVYVTGELGNRIEEQALIVGTPSGPVLITGCSHPGIVALAVRSQEISQSPFHLITGGFHIDSCSPREIGDIVNSLKNLGVKKIAPSHCSGEKGIEAFRQAWGNNFVEAGCGAVLEF